MIKNIVVIAVLLFTLGSCADQDNHNNLMVKISNSTGFDLTELMIGEHMIGEMKSGRSTNYINFEAFRFDSGMPDEPIQAKLNGEVVDGYNIFYWCGTQKYVINEGLFNMELLLVINDDKNYLRLCLSQSSN